MADANSFGDILGGIGNNDENAPKTGDLASVVSQLNITNTLLRQILASGGAGASQSAVRGQFQERYDEWAESQRSSRRSSENLYDKFEKELWDGIIGSNFSTKLSSTMSSIADNFGNTLRDIFDDFSSDLSRRSASAYRSTADRFTSENRRYTRSGGRSIGDEYDNYINDLRRNTFRRNSRGFSKGLG